MIAIADGGSTKCAWTVMNGRNKVLELQTAGINPFSVDAAQIRDTLHTEWLPQVKPLRVTHVYFYGAGCIFDKADLMTSLLQECLPTATITVGSDMEGAAKATCGDGSGIVCILGTGSNSAQYDNGRETAHVPALGYILGDEGSGTVMGRQLLSDCLKGVLPPHLQQEMRRQYGLTQADVLDKVYKQPAANRFLASFAPFLSAHLYDPYIHSLVRECLRAMVVRNLKQYDYRTHRAYFVGSIALHFEEVLREVLHAEGVEAGGICGSPMDGLINYYSTK